MKPNQPVDLPPTTTSIVVENGYGLGAPVSWPLDTPFPVLTKLVVGNNCFQFNSVVSIRELPSLEHIIIGVKSFTANHDWKRHTEERPDSLFEVADCPHLKILQMGCWSFYDFVAFRLTRGCVKRTSCIELPQLAEIRIGEMEMNSCNFYNVQSFVLEGASFYR